MVSVELSMDERRLLQCLRSSDMSSLVQLRKALAWGVPRFATTLIGLQERGLVSREGTRLFVTPTGATYLQLAAHGGRSQRGSPFAERVEVPRLSVASLYLPDHRRFLRAMDRSLYIDDVSRNDPE